MSYRKILVGLFVLASLGMALWLFANWFEHSMAAFDCGDLEVASCEPATITRIYGRIGFAFAIWGLLALLMWREWRRPEHDES